MAPPASDLRATLPALGVFHNERRSAAARDAFREPCSLLERRIAPGCVALGQEGRSAGGRSWSCPDAPGGRSPLSRDRRPASSPEVHASRRADRCRRSSPTCALPWKRQPRGTARIRYCRVVAQLGSRAAGDRDVHARMCLRSCRPGLERRGFMSQELRADRRRALNRAHAGRAGGAIRSRRAFLWQFRGSRLCRAASGQRPRPGAGRPAHRMADDDASTRPHAPGWAAVVPHRRAARTNWRRPHGPRPLDWRSTGGTAAVRQDFWCRRQREPSSGLLAKSESFRPTFIQSCRRSGANRSAFTPWPITCGCSNETGSPWPR